MAGGRFQRISWLIALCLAALATLRAEIVTVATYNVENYLAANRMVEGTYREDYPKTEAAKQALRTVIRSLDADVIALQEMGGKPYLDELQRDLERDGSPYPHAVLLEAADTDRHVAVLSRRPLKSVTRHTDLTFACDGKPEPVKRGLLEVRFDTEAGEITLFVLHLKSRYTDRQDDPLSAKRRAGEATAIRDRVLKVFPTPLTARFIIAGDCNDTPASRPLRALVSRGKTTIAEMLPAADSRGHNWTHCFRKEDTYTRVDYLLLSPGLKLLVRDGAGRVCDAPETAQASDHRPVSVVLDCRK